MAAAAASDVDNSNPPQSCFVPTVSLWDWWLTTAEQGTILAVAGYTSGDLQGKPPRRFCSSLPILKRYSSSSLETTDGIWVLLKGLMNKDRSQENGFPADVFSCFGYGFPPYWKKLADEYMVKATPSTGNEKPDMSSVVPRDKDNTYGCSIVKDCAIINMPVNPVTETVKACITSSSVEEFNVLGVNTEDSQVHESWENSSLPTAGRELDDSLPKVNVEADLKRPIKVNLFGGANSAKETLGHSNSRVKTRSMSRFGMEKKNGKASVSLSLVSDEVEVTNGDCDLKGGNNLHVEVTQLKKSSGEKYSSELDVGSVEDMPNQICETSNPEKGTKRAKKMAKNEKIQFLSEPVLSSVGSDKVESAVTDAHLEDSQVHDSREHLSPCHISTQTKGRKSEESLQKVKVYLKKPIKANLDGSVNSGEIVTPTYSRPRTRLMSKLELEKMNDKASVKPLEVTQGHGELRDGNNLHDENTHVLESNGEMYSSELNVSLVEETPKKGKKIISVDSPQLTSFKRSSSGRTLLPKLEYWRNQLPIYNTDRMVSGLNEHKQVERSRKGSGPTARKRRR